MPAIGMKESNMALTAPPQDVAVVEAAKRAVPPSPKRTSFPSIEIPVTSNCPPMSGLPSCSAT